MPCYGHGFKSSAVHSSDWAVIVHMAIFHLGQAHGVGENQRAYSSYHADLQYLVSQTFKRNNDINEPNSNTERIVVCSGHN